MVSTIVSCQNFVYLVLSVGVVGVNGVSFQNLVIDCIERQLVDGGC